MGPLAITLLLLAAFGAFGALCWRKFRLIAALQPQPRLDEPLARLKSVLVNGFLQQRMVRGEWRPGLMHAAIFLGFVTLLVRKLELIAIGYDAGFAIPGLLGFVVAHGKELVEVLVLAAVGYAFYRRLVLQPARLEPNREALLILSLITVIVLTDIGFDAFRQAADAASGHPAPLASLLAAGLSGWTPEALALGAAIFYWTQMVVVLGFLVLLPLGEHFHIVTALPALYFRRGHPPHAVPAVDLDAMMAEDADPAALKVGIATAADLGWKEGLDLYTCTECGRCKDACPTFLTGKPLSMKWVNDALKHHLWDQRAAIEAGGEAAAALPPLVGGVIEPETLWACTTCGYCEAACPIELEHLPRFFRMRQHQVLMTGEFPAEFQRVFRGYEGQSNPWGLPADSRGDWARAAGVPIVSTAEDIAALDWLWYVGSAESFDPRGQKIARAVATILARAGVRVGVLGAAEPSTGECVRRIGNEMLFQQMARELVERFSALGVKRILTADPHAYNTLRNEYPAFGGHYELIHHTQLIAQLIAEGRIRVERRLERAMLHDPCYLGRHNGEYEAPRAILAALCKDTPLEFPLARERSMCCGAGGGRMWVDERIGTKINGERVRQALPQDPSVIASACPYCAVMLGDGLKVQDLAERIASKDLAELVAEALA